LTRNAYNASDFLNFTVGEPIDEINYGFMMMIQVYEDSSKVENDIERFGSLRILNSKWEYVPGDKLDITNDINLEFHNCTIDDL
jgi:hypothetical protein